MYCTVVTILSSQINCDEVGIKPLLLLLLLSLLLLLLFIYLFIYLTFQSFVR